MKIKYLGETCVSLTHGKLYEVISIEETYYRIVDDTEADYLFPPHLFETCANSSSIRRGRENKIIL